MKNKINFDDVEIVGKGRGLSFAKNVVLRRTTDGEDLIEISGEPQESLLVMIPGLIADAPTQRLPFLVYPDGTGEVAISFEIKDENGTWNAINLSALH